ncbi:unnamed protein product [Hermetia illucens]|uniref:Innexin n=1 Tax=Hermetia illucens TaxID=343691 RepID=A0A7R8UW26_HERIL|nr:unnamed protein product [Hermetia illucens]
MVTVKLVHHPYDDRNTNVAFNTNGRALSRKIKPHLVAEGVKSYIDRAQRAQAQAQSKQPNMEFLRGVYAFMQVSRSSVNHIKIDSPVFRLHTNATVILLITFSIAVTTRQYVGNPIDCVHTRDIPEDVLNTYCWIHSTYTVVDAFMKKQGAEVPFPGVHNSQGRGPLTIKHTKYYQWVAFTLFFQINFRRIFFVPVEANGNSDRGQQTSVRSFVPYFTKYKSDQISLNRFLDLADKLKSVFHDMCKVIAW